MQEEKNVCAVCNSVTQRRCSGCLVVYYCSQEHQKSHWKTHSKNCRAYKLVENSQIGKHYIAKRDIKVGELVLYDKSPLITCPGYLRATKKGDGRFFLDCGTPPLCLGCYVVLTTNDAKPCKKCGWPLCRKCMKHGSECEFTIKHRTSRMSISKTDFGQPHPAYGIIGVIRALALRDNDPESYRKLLNLEDHSRMATEFGGSIDKAVRFVKIFFEIEDVEEAEMSKIFRIILFNSFKTFVMKEHHYAAVYELSSRIEHNCRPNCSKSFTDEGSIVFWAALPISKGDHITTSDVNPRLGTKKRREYLSTVKFFDCTCERCKDPTEFGTMHNAIKCTKTSECNGYAFPPTFIVTGGNYPDFVCRKCHKTVPRQLSDRLEKAIDSDRATLRVDSVSQCQQFIEKWGEYLHENNSYIFDVETEMACSIMYAMSELKYKSEEYLTDVVKLCIKLTERLQILAPAEHPVRAALLYLKFGVITMLNQNKSLTIDENLALIKDV